MPKKVIEKPRVGKIKMVKVLNQSALDDLQKENILGLIKCIANSQLEFVSFKDFHFLLELQRQMGKPLTRDAVVALMKMKA